MLLGDAFQSVRVAEILKCEYARNLNLAVRVGKHDVVNARRILSPSQCSHQANDVTQQARVL